MLKYVLVLLTLCCPALAQDVGGPHCRIMSFENSPYIHQCVAWEWDGLMPPHSDQMIGIDSGIFDQIGGMSKLTANGPPSLIPIDPVCSPPLADNVISCLEIYAHIEFSKKGSAVLEVGPGGRLCGPIVFRDNVGNTILKVDAGVCVPKGN